MADGLGRVLLIGDHELVTGIWTDQPRCCGRIGGIFHAQIGMGGAIRGPMAPDATKSRQRGHSRMRLSILRVILV